MVKRNFGLIIIGYGLISIGMMLLLLFFQTSGIAWLIFGVISLVGRDLDNKERKDRQKNVFQSDNEIWNKA